MDNPTTPKRRSHRDLLYKALIFIASVTIIVYFLPREGKFNYQFDINKPWKYGLLTAAFDFPIYKNESTVKLEQDSLMTLYEPYFLLNKKVEKEVLTKLKDEYNLKLKSSLPNPNYARHIEQVLQELYKAGIISTEELKLMNTDSIRSIMVVEDKMASRRMVSGTYTVKEAYAFLLNADTINFKKKLLQQCNLNEFIVPNLVYDKEKSEAERQDLLANVSWANGLVQSGQKIIDRGEIIDQHTYNILESLRKESIKRSDTRDQHLMILGGQILFVGVLILCFMLYLELFRKDYYLRKGRLSLLFIIVIFYAVLTALMVSNSFLNVHIIPFAMLPIIIRVFLDSRTAFMTHVVTVLICSITLRYPHEFILLQIIAGLVAIFSLRELSQRSQLLRSAFLITLSYCLLYFSFELIHEKDLTKLNLLMYIYFVINGMLLLFTYPLLFLLEKTFGFTSNVTLVELSNINSNLLRKLSEVAPGTFQHSMQVANLAAEAANRIGAKSQLVRTGALYHDIGKMENAVFFTENQSGVNPHKSLGYEQSAQVVVNHVTDGLKLAEKHNLPQAIKDFISTHHGKGVARYFYISYKNEHPDKEVDESRFAYPGPNPFSKETAILMMADSVEAASRSLAEYTEETISTLVDKIIDQQVDEGYFTECPITFKDISTIKTVFKEKLKMVYHTRVSYPELKD